MKINNSKFIKKAIIYTYVYNNEQYKNLNFIKDLILFNKVVCRQTPFIILNKKNEIIGVKNTLINNNLNMFLYKLIAFIIPQIKKNLILNGDVFKLDNNNNIIIVLRNKTYFFEYKTNLSSNFNYTINVKLIFNKKINHIKKFDYISKILTIKL